MASDDGFAFHPHAVSGDDDAPNIEVHGVNGSPKQTYSSRHSSAFETDWPQAVASRRARAYESSSDHTLDEYGRREVSRGISIDSGNNVDSAAAVAAANDETKFRLTSANVDPLNAPGIKMAKASSGQRLKRSSSYHKRVTANEYFMTLPSPHAADGVDLADDAGSITSTALTDDLGRRKKKRGVFDRFPLWMQVCTLMLVPIAFVTAYLSITFHDARVTRNFLTDNDEIVRGMINCQYELLIERGRNAAYLVESDPVERQKRYTLAKYERGTTDDVCDALVLMATGSKYSVISTTYNSDLRAALSGVKILRFAIDSNAISVHDYRVQFSQHVALVTAGLVLLGKESTMARRFIMLTAMRGAADRMGLCRDIGIEIAGDGRVRDEDIQIELQRYCVEDFRRLYRDFLAIASGVAMEQHYRFTNSSEAQEALRLIAEMADAEVGSRANITQDDYFDAISPVILLMDDMAYKVADQINLAKDENAVLMAEAAKLFATLVASLIGVAFVSRAQRRSTAKVEFALDRTKKTALAVQAFVPRSFLKLIGSSSILTIERGDQTAVAITMLFCDIRNFTGISEKMSNDSLFTWLQNHLQRMTHCTETHGGIVNYFAGDAVQSIFGSPTNAVKCAIRMQSVTDSLCYQLVAQNSDDMVRIGVGIHHAIVGVGIMGSQKSHSCAIVSAEVNVAAQLEALTKEYGARILLTGQVFDQLAPDAFEARPLGRVRLSPDAVRDFTLYEVFAADFPDAKAYKERTLGQWEAVLSCRESDRFAEADTALDEMAVVAAEYKIKDPALAIKRRTRLPVDQFDL